MTAPIEAELKGYVRSDCLRDDYGKARPEGARLRVLALFIEGTMEGQPPLKHWESPDETGWTEETLDVDGLVGKMMILCNREVTAKRTVMVFRLCAILGQSTAISPSTITHSFPFTLRPTKKILAQDGDEASPFAQSVGNADARGFDGLGFRALSATSELLFPQLNHLIEEKNTTIEDLRSRLREVEDNSRSRIKELEDEVRAAKDQHIQHMLQLREQAFKQRLKERGIKTVVNTLTMIVSAYMSGKTQEQQEKKIGPGGGGGGARQINGQPHPKVIPQTASAEGGGGGGSAEENGVAAGSAAAQEQMQEEVEQDPDQITFERAAKGDFDIDSLFSILVKEIEAYAIEVMQAVPVEGQGIVMQAFQEWRDTGKVGRILITQFCDNFETDNQVHAIMHKIRSKKGQAALAAILRDHLLKKQADEAEGEEFAKDIEMRAERMSSGEIGDVAPQITSNPEKDIEVKMPKFYTHEEAAKRRQGPEVVVTATETRTLPQQGSKKVEAAVVPPRKEKPL
jgi:hypothetical protein